VKHLSRSLNPITIAIFAVVLVEIMVPCAALAEGLTWTTSTSSPSVTADNSVSLTFTLTNGLPLSIVPDHLAILAGPGVTGNPLLGLNGVTTPTSDPNACFAIAYLTDGSSCAQTVVLSTFNSPGDSDPNAETVPLDIALVYSPFGARQDQFTVDSNPLTLTISPAPRTVTPEPGTFLMLGIGLVGVALLMRKRQWVVVRR
jgi:hypothetical protein